MAAPDEYADLTFPLAGLDLSAEYGGQAPLTTPTGDNVRAFEPDSYRARGGSRPGISRYVSDQVSGTNLIQHLAVIVDPTPRGLPAFTVTAPTAPLDGSVDLGGGLVGDPTEGASPPVPPSPPTTDPSTNNGPIPRNNGNREPRDGGSGFQPNRNLPPPPPPPPDVVYVQSTFQPVPGTYTPGFSDFGFGGGNARRTVSLPSHVADGNLLVCLVAVVSNPAATMQVRNALLDPYVQIGTTALSVQFGQRFQLQMWARIAQSGTSEDSVLVDMDQPCGLSVGLFEFRNALAPIGTQPDGFTKNQDQSGAVSTVTTNGVAVSLDGGVLVAGFSDNNQTLDTAAGVSPFVLVVNQYDGTDMPSLLAGYTLAPTPPSVAGEVTYSPGANWSAVGATFKKA